MKCRGRYRGRAEQSDDALLVGGRSLHLLRGTQRHRRAAAGVAVVRASSARLRADRLRRLSQGPSRRLSSAKRFTGQPVHDTIRDAISQEAQLSSRDRAMRGVN